MTANEDFSNLAKVMFGTSHLERFLSQAVTMDVSVWNSLKAIRQYPPATQVAGWKEWHERGISVKYGARPITILAPVTVKKGCKTAEEGVATSFVEVEVYDISQTNANPKKVIAEDMHPKVMAALAKKMGMQVVYADVELKEHVGRTLKIKKGIPDSMASQLICQEMSYLQILAEEKCSERLAKAISYTTAYAVESVLGGNIPKLSDSVKAELVRGKGFYKNLCIAVSSARRILTAIGMI